MCSKSNGLQASGLEKGGGFVFLGVCLEISQMNHRYVWDCRFNFLMDNVVTIAVV